MQICQATGNILQNRMLNSECGASYGRRGGVDGPLGPVWPPWGRGRSPGPCLGAVGAWPFPWAPSGRRWEDSCETELDGWSTLIVG